jgi:branched-chain amino acid transport system ATP-binding protein
MASLGHLIVENITAGYGGAPVLANVSLSLHSGESVAVLGRNGAGKTTLLRALTGLLPLESGRVVLDGTYIDRLPAQAIARRGIAHVPEGRRVFPGMTVLDNVKIGGFVLNATQLAQRLEYIYDLFPQLASWSKRRAGSLSGGEQQLLVLARAMMPSPKVLLLDEPLTGLAPVWQSQVLEALRRIQHDHVTVLLVEQNVHQSLRVTTRALLLEQGRITLEGDSSQLAGHPRIREGYLGVAGDPNLTSGISAPSAQSD